MFRTVIAGIAFVAILAGGVAGYRLGAGAWPALSAIGLLKTASGTDAKGTSPAAGRTVLYWKHPDGEADFSQEPKRTPDGRDYVPVYEDQEADFKDSKPQAKMAANDKGGNRKILYYRNPMGLADTSPVPKKDWMGMDYIPVYEGEDEPGTVTVSLDKVQRSGVRTALVERRSLVQAVRAPGTAKPDERSLRIVSLRAPGDGDHLFRLMTTSRSNR